MKLAIRKFLLAGLWVPLAALAIDETPLSMVYEATPPIQPNIPNVLSQPAGALLPGLENCRLALRNVEDLRPNKETTGGMTIVADNFPASVPLNAWSLRSGDGTAWLKGAVGSLRTAGLPPREPTPADGVDVALRLSQAWTSGLNIHSHVVLQASYPAEGGARAVRRYHGFATKLNGFGANAEFMTTLNMGMQDALQRFAQDLQRACKGESLSAG